MSFIQSAFGTIVHRVTNNNPNGIQSHCIYLLH